MLAQWNYDVNDKTSHQRYMVECLIEIWPKLGGVVYSFLFGSSPKGSFNFSFVEHQSGRFYWIKIERERQKVRKTLNKKDSINAFFAISVDKLVTVNLCNLVSSFAGFFVYVDSDEIFVERIHRTFIDGKSISYDVYVCFVFFR